MFHDLFPSGQEGTPVPVWEVAQSISALSHVSKTARRGAPGFGIYLETHLLRFLIRPLRSWDYRRTAEQFRWYSRKMHKNPETGPAATTCGDRVSGPQSYSDRNCRFSDSRAG